MDSKKHCQETNPENKAMGNAVHNTSAVLHMAAKVMGLNDGQKPADSQGGKG